MSIHVLTVLFNPGKYNAVIKNAERFLEQMYYAGLKVTLVESAFGNTEHSKISDKYPNVNHVKLRSNSTLWIKENLANIGLQHIEDENILLCDSDVQFLDEKWIEKLEHALKHYKVVQPWSECIRTGPDGEFVGHDISFCSQYVKGEKWPGHPAIYGPLWHPGYVWAFRRSALEATGGFIEIAICGAADHHMACSLIGKAEYSIPKGLTNEYVDEIKKFEKRAEKHIQRDVGYIKGTIRHYWHGRAVDRRYQERWNILKNNKFNPRNDLKKNLHGVFELEDNKPDLRDDLRAYFRNRNDDANTLS